MNKLKTLLVSILMIWSLSASEIYAQSFTEAQLSEPDRKAYTLLLHAERFEGVGIGYSGTLSELVKAYRFLLQGPSADAAFKRLVENATLPGQLYALCGIYFTDREYFRSTVEKYRHNNAIVPTQFGCILGGMPVSILVESTGSNVVRLDSPEQSIHEWMEMHKAGSVSLDIIGGGYPSWFRGKRP